VQQPLFLCRKYRETIIEDIFVKWYNKTILCLKCYMLVKIYESSEEEIR